MDDLSAGVVELVTRRINSVEQVAVLMLLHAEPGREWSVEAISVELRSAVSSIEQRLRDLYNAGVLAAPAGRSIRFAPKSAEMAQAIEQLLEAYRSRPNRVIELIYSKSHNIQAFADAFKLKKGGDS